MPALRDEIRAILREELAALRGETAAPVTERISLADSDALNRFARGLVERAASADFRDRVARGDLRFELAQETPAPRATPIVTGPARPRPETLDKRLITERDIAALAGRARHLRIAPHSRLTPLARDEARRLGIRIEREER